MTAFQEIVKMTYFEKELAKLKSLMYSNQEQIEMVIGVRNYIDNNYDSRLNLDFLSQVRFVSKYHMLRLFKRHYGVTPRQYLIDKRISGHRLGIRGPAAFRHLFRSDTIGGAGLGLCPLGA
ncbi:MAG: AraC family transcriptional regulator, partial [Bacteroidota bacterium]